MQELLQYLFSGLTTGAIYAVIGVGFSMLFRSTELINFAHGEFVMLGAMILVLLWKTAGLPLIIAAPLAALATAFAGVLFERTAIRTARKPQPIVLVIITVGASIFLRGIAMLIWGKDTYSLPSFSPYAPPIDVAGAMLLPQSVWIFIAVFSVSLTLYLFYHKTITGKAMIACAISRKAAWLMGIPAEKMTLLAFGISGALGGIAGIFIAPITMCSYDMGTLLGLKGFCAAMIGGLGNLWGALLGGFLLGILEAFGVGLLSSAFKDAIAFFLLLLILYFRPGGIIKTAVTERF
jgi:branched-chain amino acid transport system permease protein